MGKINFTIINRFNSNDLPIISLPKIIFEFIRNIFLTGSYRLISLNLKIKKHGILKIKKRLLINIFTNTLNSNFLDKTYINITHRGKVDILGDVYLSNGCNVFCDGKLTIGEGTYFNARTSIQCFSEISIGSNCAISWDVSIIDSDVHKIKQANLNNTNKIIIGNNVWIGANAKILKGVNIGDGSVIAANSLVTKSIPSHTLIGGNPAHIIKNGISWE